MRHEISYRPTFAQLRVHLDYGEAVQAESGAMLGHSRGIDIETGMGGGLLQSLKRSVLGGESFFLNRFEAREPGTVTFAPRLPGDVIERDLAGEPLFVQSSSFLAGSPEVDLDTKFGGFKTFFAGEGLFLLRLTGPGSAFLSSFGAIDEVRLRPGEGYVVDTGHVVAFESSVPYSVRRVGGLTSTVLSGEGLVVEFEGPGTVWTQSRSPDAFLSWISANVSPGGAVVPAGLSSDAAPVGGGPPAGQSAAGSGTPDGQSASGVADRPRDAGRRGGRKSGNAGRRWGSKPRTSPNGGRGREASSPAGGSRGSSGGGLRGSQGGGPRGGSGSGSSPGGGRGSSGNSGSGGGRRPGKNR